MDTISNSQFKNLRDALAVLKANADQQIEYLKQMGLGPNVDELALEFDDVAGTAISLLEKGQLTQEAFDAIQRVNQLLDNMSASSDRQMWTYKGLRNGPKWQEVRLKSELALQKMSNLKM